MDQGRGHPINIKQILAGLAVLITITGGIWAIVHSLYKDEVERLRHDVSLKERKIKELTSQSPSVTKPVTTEVTGKITDILGNPTKEAIVALDSRYSAVTDADGRFLLKEVPLKSGYMLEVHRYPHEGRHRQTLDVSKNQKNIDVNKFPEVKIKGVFARKINRQEREPIGETVEDGGEIEVPVGDMDRPIYLHTRFWGVQVLSQIKHVWYYEGDFVSTKTLNVNVSLSLSQHGPSLSEHGWRTWSRWPGKRNHTGLWEVKVLTKGDKVIARFALELASA